MTISDFQRKWSDADFIADAKGYARPDPADYDDREPTEEWMLRQPVVADPPRLDTPEYDDAEEPF